MRYSALILIAFLLIPNAANADEVLSPQEAWQYLYEFRYSWDGLNLTQAAPYQISSGAGTVIVPGSWQLEIQSERRQLLAFYDFDPSAMAEEGVVVLRVPHEGSGFYAVIRAPDGTLENEIRVSASRVCDDNGSCDRDAGEAPWLCPSDCGVAASDDRTARSATLADQVPVGTRIGALLLRLSMAVAGAMLLIGGWHMLDSRRRP